MLRELHISGLGVIAELDVELRGGLNVITGETGAGKTMVTTGLALALGQRASASLVRAGARVARVQARFDAPPEAVRAGWAEDGEVILSRQVTDEGRSTARVGGVMTPVSTLAELGADLVEAHGQHQGLRLLASDAQTAFLDRAAGPRHLRLADEVGSAVTQLRALRERLAESDIQARDRDRELDLLSYQIREIEAVAPTSGEGARLAAEEGRLAHAERLVELAAEAVGTLAGDEAAVDGLRGSAAALRAAADLDPGAEGLAERAAELAEEAADLAREVRGYRDRLQLDPARLEDVRHRIAALRDLERKYGADEEEVLAFLEGARARALELEGQDARREGLEAEVRELEDHVRGLSERLARGRRAAAPGLASAIVAELDALGMQGARVEISLVPLPEIVQAGTERAEFRFSGGPGQPLLPLSKVASGGELSRTMLACRSVMVDLDDVPTLVFDEVDVGIGGRAATAVGRRLARLAERRQVIVVTHLPQIAAFADRHLFVEKRAGVATVEVLDDAGRVEELSRMLSGLPQSESASIHASELLAEADRARSGR